MDVEELVRPPAWHADALCREVVGVSFFPERGEDPRPAKRVCYACLVQEECRAWALSQPITLVGVWGGTSQLDRRLLSRGHAICDGCGAPFRRVKNYRRCEGCRKDPIQRAR